jgi:hypothetical protein
MVDLSFSSQNEKAPLTDEKSVRGLASRKMDIIKSATRKLTSIVNFRVVNGFRAYYMVLVR